MFIPRNKTDPKLNELDSPSTLTMSPSSSASITPDFQVVLCH
jgi:hypothetical protein